MLENVTCIVIKYLIKVRSKVKLFFFYTFVPSHAPPLSQIWSLKQDKEQFEFLILVSLLFFFQTEAT